MTKASLCQIIIFNKVVMFHDKKMNMKEIQNWICGLTVRKWSQFAIFLSQLNMHSDPHVCRVIHWLTSLHLFFWFSLRILQRKNIYLQVFVTTHTKVQLISNQAYNYQHQWKSDVINMVYRDFEMSRLSSLFCFFIWRTHSSGPY